MLPDFVARLASMKGASIEAFLVETKSRVRRITGPWPRMRARSRFSSSASITSRPTLFVGEMSGIDGLTGTRPDPNERSMR